MGDMYGYGSCNINPSSSPTLPPSSSSYSPQDEFSLFLRQILLPPSSSTPPSSSLMPKSKSASNALCTSNATHENASLSYPSSLLQDVIFAVDSASSNPAFFSSYINGSSATNVSSSTVGVSEYETDEYDCESEGGTVEAMVEEVPTKSVRPRSSSKRSRAAEVHNLSEKRRRSRINEKMKALQNLIPNSNKTDKASMLDEAIEYLKQLQLKVQMLSMRNGLSLHPMCFPQGLQPLQLSQMRMECGEENRFNPLNLTATNLPRHHSSSLPDKHTVPSPSNIINSETSFGLDSPILGHLELTRSSEICREDVLQYQHLNANNSDTNPLGGSQGTLATVSLSFEMKDNWKHGLQEEISQKSF